MAHAAVTATQVAACCCRGPVMCSLSSLCEDYLLMTITRLSRCTSIGIGIGMPASSLQACQLWLGARIQHALQARLVMHGGDRLQHVLC